MACAPEARREARRVKRLARSLGVAHRTLRWTAASQRPDCRRRRGMRATGCWPSAARDCGAPPCADRPHARRSGGDRPDPADPRQRRQRARRHGARSRRCPERRRRFAVRPLLGLRKARLIATLRKAGVAYADDPSNRDPRFTRVRFRAAMPMLEREGLTPSGWRCWRAGCGGPKLRWRPQSTRRWPSLRRCLGREHGPIAFPAEALRDCRPKSRCGCWAAPSPGPATRGRSNSASSKRFMPAWPLRQTPRGFDAPWPGRWCHAVGAAS